MRFDQTNQNISTAKDIINNLSYYELNEIFQKFGEEKFSDLLAK